MRTFKVPRHSQPPFVVTGELIAEAAGAYHALQVIRTAEGDHLSVILMADEADDLHLTSRFSSAEELCGWLHSFGEQPANTLAARAVADELQNQAVRLGLDPAEMEQDFLEVVKDVLGALGEHSSRP
jgi:hypothetical protein